MITSTAAVIIISGFIVCFISIGVLLNYYLFQKPYQELQAELDFYLKKLKEINNDTTNS